MKTSCQNAPRRPRRLIIVTVLVALAAAQNSFPHAAVAAPTLQAMSSDCQAAQMQAARTEDALDDLIVASLPDLKPTFNKFVNQVKTMEMLGGRVLGHTEALAARGEAYFTGEGGAGSCPVPQRGTLLNPQSAELAHTVEALSELGLEVKRAYRAFQFDLDNLRRSLGDDLSPAGLEAMDQIVSKAKVDGASLQEVLEKEILVLEKAKVETAARFQGPLPLPAPAPAAQEPPPPQR